MPIGVYKRPSLETQRAQYRVGSAHISVISWTTFIEREVF